MNRWFRGCLPVAQRACAPIVNTPRLRTATSLVAGPGSRVTAVAAAHHRLRGARRGAAATMRASLGVYLPTYVRGYAEQRDRGGCRVGWVGWLDTGLGSMHTARPTPLLRCHLALSSSFNPLQPYHRLRVLRYLSLSLSLTFFLCLSSPPPVPLSLFPPLAECVFFYLSLPVAPLLLAARQSVNPAG